MKISFVVKVEILVLIKWSYWLTCFEHADQALYHVVFPASNFRSTQTHKPLENIGVRIIVVFMK